jgi:hypothetical protein
MAWVTGTKASDDAVEELDAAAAYLAEAHPDADGQVANWASHLDWRVVGTARLLG